VLADFGDGKMTDPVCPHYTSADNEPNLSVDCTVGLLLSSEQAVAVLGPLTAQLQGDLIKKMTLRGILGFAKLPAEQIRRIDEALRLIPNP
jgi:hypothetical protein